MCKISKWWMRKSSLNKGYEGFEVIVYGFDMVPKRWNIVVHVQTVDQVDDRSKRMTPQWGQDKAVEYKEDEHVIGMWGRFRRCVMTRKWFANGSMNTKQRRRRTFHTRKVRRIRFKAAVWTGDTTWMIDDCRRRMWGI
jgi:hypothetical protein